MRRRQFFLSATGLFLANAQKLRADHHVVSADPLVVEFDLWSLEGHYTQVEDFYIRNHFEAPENTGGPSLEIEGEVGEPRKLSPDDLTALPRGEISSVLECAGDPVQAVSLVSDGIWQGWRLSDVIRLAHPRHAGAFLHLFGSDGFSRSVPMDQAMSNGWLVTSLNRRPLMRNHGAPWRALFPGWYGMESVKWLERLVVARKPLPPVGNTYLEIIKRPSGGLETWPLPRVQVKSVITRPTDGAVVHRGTIQVRGLAWSGYGRITSVKVSADGGVNWETARLGQGASRYDWALWTASLELAHPGVVEIASKATDASGNTQPETRPPGRLDFYAYNVYGRIRCVVA
jgi:DMSO/TMAO reductase YedYZ molybdopterin-dependent catalytic subunit